MSSAVTRRWLVAATLVLTLGATGCSADDDPADATLTTALPSSSSESTGPTVAPSDPTSSETEVSVPPSAGESPRPTSGRNAPDALNLATFGLKLADVTPDGNIFASDVSLNTEARITFAVRDSLEADNVLSGITHLFQAAVKLSQDSTIIVKNADGYAAATTLGEVLATSSSAYTFTLYYRYSGMVVKGTVAQASAGVVLLSLSDHTTAYQSGK